MKFFLSLFVLFLVFFSAFLIIKNNRQKYSKPLKVFEKSPFVRSSGTDLYVNGRIFRSIGVNRYNLLSYELDLHCANSFSLQDIDKMFSELHGLGITSLRFWLFQSFTQSGKDLSRFDYIIKKAEEYNLKLIPVFENHWADCTEGEIKEDSWYESDYRQPLKDYIGKIVTLYKDQPTILAWQIMNEAEAEDEEVLYNFAKEVSEYIASLDENHLISLGTSGTKQSAKMYRKIHALKSLDILDYHDYGEPNNKLPRDLALRFTDSGNLNKPLMLGEAGTDGVADEQVKEKISTFFQKGGSIYLLWSYGNDSVTDDGHNFDTDSSLAPVIKSLTESL